MSVGKTLLLTILLLTSIFSGCTFLHQTHFTLLSLVVNDDQGFPRMDVQFNTSDMIDLRLIGPTETVLFSETYYAGIHNESIYFSEYRKTIPSGIYRLEAVDSSKKTIYENEVSYHGDNLSLTTLSVDGWNKKTNSPIITLHLSLRNTGDLPAYPYRLTVTQGSSTENVLLPPTVVLPSSTEQVTCFISSLESSPASNQLSIALYDSSESLRLHSNHTVMKKNQITSWEYTWYYLGTHTLMIPQVDWFANYYKNLDRFDLVDYAAYVFDPYDDQYIQFLVDQILQLRELGTDVEKINFVASFVQSIEYKNDDPDNESYEYPRYPIETLHDKQGDCEDKAILTAALLQSLGYNVSLLRLPKHMAVGVRLNETIPSYSYYIDQYYFLETTTLHMNVGKIPEEYEGLTNVTVYPLTSRSLLAHRWKNATRYTVSNGEDYVRLQMILENLGNEITTRIEVRGAFYDNQSRMFNQETMMISPLNAGEKRLVILSVDVPAGVSTVLKSQVYLNGMMINSRESTSHFP
ncbi:MAG TPA: transglutaminase domain-containing protein [Thermoplasmata archaeon]|jgi:predicted transglutaminase-like cysteine proteinase|nr:transglutaminase domain-containing protein [Thermoplasmata archaeon]